MDPFRIPGRRSEDGEQRRRIALIAESGDVRSLTELLPFLPAESHRLGTEASNAATLVLRRTSPLQLAWFDQWYRSGWLPKGPPAPAWKEVRLGTSAWARQFPGVVALASFHGNGFVREVAVRLLADFDDGFELPFLLIRANDWAAQVQATAISAVSKRVAIPYAEHWLRSLALVESLRQTHRRWRDLYPLVDRVEALLLERELRPAIESALSNGELPVRRACLRLIASLPASDAYPMWLRALHDPDPLVAIRAAQTLLADVRAHAEPHVLAQTLSHRLARVRVLALEAIKQRDPESAIPALQKGLLDDARSVREIARYDLAKTENGIGDFTSFYRNAVREHEGRERIAALEGLAEVGSRDAMDLFLEFLRDPNARMRAAAIVGVGRCDGSNHLDDLAAALEDSSSLVRRAALQYARLYLGRGVVHRIRRSRST